MTRIRLRYVHEYLDRHGRLRRYFRRGRVKIALPGAPGTPEFVEAYRDAVAQHAAGGPPIGAARTSIGTIDALAVAYYKSTAYLGLRDATKATYRGEIERLRIEHGEKRVARLERQHVGRMIADKLRQGGPQAANNRLRTLRMLMRVAIDLDWRPDDPTLGVRGARSDSQGFHSWTEAEIEAFETRWPIGTRARLAFALLLYTGQRRGDVVRMGRQHVRNGVLDVRQSKTGAELQIPLHPELARIVEAAARGQLTYLTTGAGKPFTAAGFGNWFRECCEQAGLPNCSAHGLRKAAARRLAEAGCSAHQIAAVTGHKTLKEVERYTRAAEQKRLAEAAIAAVSGTDAVHELANLATVSQNSPVKSLRTKEKK
jgi:integrase